MCPAQPAHRPCPALLPRFPTQVFPNHFFLTRIPHKSPVTSTLSEMALRICICRQITLCVLYNMVPAKLLVQTLHFFHLVCATSSCMFLYRLFLPGLR